MKPSIFRSNIRRSSPPAPAQPVGKPPQQITPMPRVPMGGGSFNADQMQKIQKMKEMQQGFRAKPLGTMGSMPSLETVKQTLMQRGIPLNYNPTKMKKGGSVGSASKRADGIATRGKTRGRMV